MWGAEEIGGLCAPLSLPYIRTRLSNRALHQPPDPALEAEATAEEKGHYLERNRGIHFRLFPAMWQ